MAFNFNGDSFLYCKLITIDGSKVTTESGIPLGLNINLPGVKTGGADVRLSTFGGAPIAREIECVGVPNASDVMIWYPFDTTASTDSQLYIYWGNAALTEPAANSTYGSQAVWDSNAVGTWLFNTDPSVEILDSSINGYDATTHNFIDTDDIDTDFGKAINMDGSKYMTLPIPITDISPIEFTFRAYHGIDTADFIIDTGWWTAGNDFFVHLPTSNLLNFGIRNGDTASQLVTDTTVTAGWHIYTARYDGSYLTGFMDGVKDTNSAACSLTTITSDDWVLGKQAHTAQYINNDISFLSIIDTATHSDGYIITQHHNIINPTATGTTPFYLSFVSQSESESPPTGGLLMMLMR